MSLKDNKLNEVLDLLVKHEVTFKYIIHNNEQSYLN